jgi:hypothetical protein
VEVFDHACTRVTDWLSQTVTIITSRHGLHKKHRNSVVFSILAIENYMFNNPLLRNSSGIFAYKNLLPSNGRCSVARFAVVA